MHGKFVWYELMTTDTKAAESFYKKVVGWSARDAGMPGIEYTLFFMGDHQVAGLMTMPPWSDDPDATRPYFRRLAALGREYGLSALSMGMSHDLEAAIEEGATHIRIGTALFGKRTPKK